MSHESEKGRFAQTVERLSLMSAELGQTIFDEATKLSLSPTEMAVRKSLLNEIEADIVETLLNPMECVPGFEILDFVAKGGMGAVFRARQLSLDRVVAIKTILASKMHNKQSVELFELEARTVAKLRHPNIVDALDFGQHGERWYFAMEFIDGDSAQSMLRDNRATNEATCWSIVRQAAAGLQHAFRVGVMHHDIKPANLMLLEPPEGYQLPEGVPMVKIADFGLSYLNQLWEIENAGSQNFAPAGSPPYMAPELFRGGRPDHLSDIYSLGVTALHLLTGQRVFFGVSREEILADKNLPGTVVTAERFPKLSTSSRAALTSMIAPNPTDRPQNYDELNELITALCRAESEEFELVEPNEVSQAGALRLPSTQSRSLNSETVMLSADSDARLRSLSSSATNHAIWRYGLLAVPLVILLVAAIAIGSRRFNERPAAERITNVVATQTLFDGSTLSGFAIDQSMTGAWRTITAPDSSPAFVCDDSQGAITRVLPQWETYRLSLFVFQGSESKFTDVAFDFGKDGVNSVVRLSKGQVAIGERSGDFGDFRPGNLPTVDAPLQQRFHVLNIERQKDGWLVFFEEEFLGSVPIRHNENENENPDESIHSNRIRICLEQRDVADDAHATCFTEFFVERLEAADITE